MRLRRARRPIRNLGLTLLAGVIGVIWESPLPQLAGAQLAPARQTGAGGDEPLKDLAEWILRSPRAEQLTSHDDSRIAQLVLRQEGPARRAIYVRRKGPGETDVVFIVVTPSEETYYYHATVNGKLVKAAHAHGTLDPIAAQDALNAFRHERDFWLNWVVLDHGKPATRASSNQ